MSAKLSFSQHCDRRSSINSDSISINFETLDITTPEITNHRGREADVSAGWKENTSVLFGGCYYGEVDRLKSG